MQNPDVENDRPTIGNKFKTPDFHSERSNVLCFKRLTPGIALEQGSLADPAITDQNELELRNLESKQQE